MRSERALTLIGAIVALAVLVAVVVIPYLDQSRRIVVEVPQPAPLTSTSLVELSPGRVACADQIGLLPGRELAEIRVGTYGKPPVPLLLELAGPGYRERVSVPPTYVDNALVDVPLQGSPKPVEGHVCITNRGRRLIALYASADRTKSRSTTTVSGRLWPSNFDLTFYEAGRHSLLDRAGPILERLRIFHAHLGIGLLWLLAVLFVFGIPLATLAASLLGLREGSGRSAQAARVPVE